MSGSDKSTSIKLSAHWIERLDKLTKQADLSRQQLMHNIIEVGIDAIEFSSKVGVFQLGLMIRDLLDLRRKPVTGGETPLPLKVDEKVFAKVEMFAEKSDLTRHQLMRNLILVGIEELEGSARVGVFQLSVALRDLGGTVKKIVKDGQRAISGAQDARSHHHKKGGEPA